MNGIKIKLFLILLTVTLITSGTAGISTADSEVSKDNGEASGKVVARVNGQPIYEDDLAPYIRRELKKYQKYGAKKDMSALEKRLQRRALDNVIALELIKQESRKLQIKDMEEQIEARLKEMKSRHKGEEKYKEFLKAKGLTESDVKESVKNRICLERYMEIKGIRNPGVPDEEIREYYDNNRKGFRREEYIRASHILIMVKEADSSEEKEQARGKAESIRKELLDGRDFAETAKEYSEDAKASQGGDLGYIKRGYMPPEFDEAAFSLEKDRVSEIVMTKHGYHIIKVLDRKPEGIAPYEDVKDFIGKYLQEGLVRKKRAKHVNELRSKADIEIYLNGS